MLHILLTILKVTGIIIAVIIGIILLLAAIILFVPVRYKASGIYGGEPDGNFCVSWLLHLVRIKGSFNRDGPEYVFKVLWFTLRGKGRKRANDDAVGVDADIDINDDINDIDVNVGEEVDTAERVNDEESEEQYEKEEKKHKKENIFSKICGKIKNVLKRIKEKIRSILEKIERIRDKADEIREFVGRKEVKSELKIIKEQAFKLLRHVFPTRLEVNARIGLGEPDKTGIAVGFMSALCVITGKYINITADFEQKIIEGDFSLKGRIRVFTVLKILLKIYLQKNVVAYVKNFKL